MKTSVLAILLACAAAAAAQQATQPKTAVQPTQVAAADPQAAAPQGQPSGSGAPSEGAPTIKDPAEYNAYVNAYQQQDPNAKISGLEAFLTQYPNSVMKSTALEVLMGTYQQTGNQAKVVDTAKRLLGADACNLRALALLTFLDRQLVSANQNPQENLAGLTQYANKGVECVASAPKPGVLSQSDWDNLKKQVGPIFEGGAGFAALQNKDFSNAQTHLKAAVDANPNDLQNVYPLAMSYISANPPDTEKGLCALGRAIAIAPAGSQTQTSIQTYAQRVYKNYHGSEEGWKEVLAAAKDNPNAECKISKYVPPTPAQQAHDIVTGKTPDQISQLSFGEWELVLSAGSPEDQDKVWSVIKGKPLQMEGSVIEVTSNTQLSIAASADDIEAKRGDITLTMNGPIPAARMPKAGDTFDFEGTATSYTPSPFMMMMEQGKLLRKASAPAPKAPVHHHPVHRAPSQ
jgi:hypothetical protein